MTGFANIKNYFDNLKGVTMTNEWKLVPVKPTVAMMHEFYRNPVPLNSFSVAYKAMVDESPTPNVEPVAWEYLPYDYKEDEQCEIWQRVSFEQYTHIKNKIDAGTSKCKVRELFTHPAPPNTVAVTKKCDYCQCVISSFYSGVCNRGTKCCEIKHDTIPVPNTDEQLKKDAEAMTETAKEASARAIKDHNEITIYREALEKITTLKSRTFNYAVARDIAQEAIDKARSE